MRLTTVGSGLAAAAFIALSQTALAQSWTDHFDFYSAGDVIDPNGQTVGVGNGWESWSNGVGSSVVSNAQAFSGFNSLENVPGSDTVNNFNPAFATSGRWLFDAWVYHPSGYTGESFWIMLNTYDFGGPYSWSIQVSFDGTTNLVDCDCNNANGGGPHNLINDSWIPIHADIDLDADVVDIFYNGNSLTGGTGYSWASGIFGGGGISEIQGMDLFPSTNNIAMFYDEMTLVPDSGLLGVLDPLCVPNPNTVGQIARIKLTGTGLAGDPVFGSVSGGVPGQFGYFISGLSGGLYIQPPNSDGIICMGSPLRYNSGALGHVYQFDANGDAGPVELQTNGTFAPVPPVQAGDTRHFQAWHRDTPPGPPSNSNFSDAYSVLFGTGTVPRVTSVTPATGGHLSAVQIFGSGFDPNPLNNCVFLADRTVSGNVVAATSTTLLVAVGASENTGNGRVQVVRGTGMTLPDFPVTLGGNQTVGGDRALFTGSATGAGGDFTFAPATPNTVDFDFSLFTLTLDVADLGAAWVSGTQILVDIHIKANGVWCDAREVITFGNGPWTTAQCAEHIAAQIQGFGAFNVSIAGSTITVSKPGTTSGFGSIRRLN